MDQQHFNLGFGIKAKYVSIQPPQRQRIEDIPALVQHFIERKAKELKISTTPMLSGGAIDILMAYDRPGNVRELENVIERAMILNQGNSLTFEGLGASPADKTDADAYPANGKTPELETLIKRHIQHVLDLTDGKIHGPGGAGVILGVNPDTLRYKMKKLVIPYGRRSGVPLNFQAVIPTKSVPTNMATSLIGPNSKICSFVRAICRHT